MKKGLTEKAIKQAAFSDLNANGGLRCCCPPLFLSPRVPCFITLLMIGRIGSLLGTCALERMHDGAGPSIVPSATARRNASAMVWIAAASPGITEYLVWIDVRSEATSWATIMMDRMTIAFQYA